MDRTAAIAAIKAAMPSIDQTVLDGMTDDQLLALASNLPAAPVVSNPDAAGDQAAMMADVPQSHEDLISALTALGEDPAVLATMDDAALTAKWVELTGGAVVDPIAQPAATPMGERPGQTGRTGQTGQSGRQPSKVTLQFAERQAQQTLARTQALNAKLTAEERKVANRLTELKRKEVAKFCEQLVGEGRIRPVDVEVYSAALMSLDDNRATHKFSDTAGKTEMLTPFVAKQRELLKLPQVIKFGEKLQGGAGKPDATVETEKVRRFAESSIMVDALKATGKKPENYVHVFAEKLKKDPNFTAAQYGVPAEYA